MRFIPGSAGAAGKLQPVSSFNSGATKCGARDDLAWSKAITRVLVNEEEGVPEVARFNAGQKFVFWAMALLVPVLFFSGLVIWEVYFSSYTTIEQQRIALLIHSLAAIAAIIVWIIHVYAGIWVKARCAR